MATIITDNEFNEKVINNKNLVLVDFYADWCGPCKMLAPIIDELTSVYSGKVDIYKLNVDESKSISMNYGVRSIPTVILFKNGEVADKIVGLIPKEDIESKIDALL